MTETAKTKTQTGPGQAMAGSRRAPPRVIPIHPATLQGKGWRTPPDLSFLNDIGTVPVTLTEVTRLAAHVPILFRKTGHRVEPLAIYRLFEGQAHSFLEADNRLRRTARPLAAALYPFVALPGKAPGELCLGFDRGADPQNSLLIPEWEDDARAFFTPEGKPDPTIFRVSKALAKLQTALAQARKAAEMLDQAGCLVPVKAEDQGRIRPDFWSVHRPTLDALRGDTLTDLQHTGALALAYAHLTSLEPLRALLAAGIGKPGQPATPTTSQSSGEDAEMEGFLAVLAQDLGEDGFDEL